MIRRFFTPQFFAFLLTGGVAAIANLGARFVIDRFTSFEIAIVLAYAIGMATAFTLARRFVFIDATRTTAESIPRFVVVNLIGLTQTWLVSLALVRSVFPSLGIVRFAAELAHLVGVAVPVFTSFIGHRVWTFRDGSVASRGD